MTISENYNPMMSTSLPTYIHVIGGSRHFHKGGGGIFFQNGISKQFVLRKIKTFWAVIQSENYKTW